MSETIKAKSKGDFNGIRLWAFSSGGWVEMNIELLLHDIHSVAVFITSMTIIGGALIWIYQKTIGNSRERRAEERNRVFIQSIDDKNKPLIETLEALQKSVEKQEYHDKQLEKIAQQNSELIKKQEERIDNHNDRLLVVETVLDINGNKKEVNYYGSSNK